MLSIKSKTAFTNILEGGLPPTAINGHFDRYTKTMTRMTHFQTLSFYFPIN